MTSTTLGGNFNQSAAATRVYADMQEESKMAPKLKDQQDDEDAEKAAAEEADREEVSSPSSSSYSPSPSASSASSASSSRNHSPACSPPPVVCEKPDLEYIPPMLRSFVFHSSEDFYISQYFDPLLVAHLMFEGFLPIATEYHHQYLLLPKLHLWRSVVQLRNPASLTARDATKATTTTTTTTSSTSSSSTANMIADTTNQIDQTNRPAVAQPLDHGHVPKSVKKRAKDYHIVLNQDFDEVIKGCHEQHGIPWLYPPIVETFREMFEHTKADLATGVELFELPTTSSAGAARHPQQRRKLANIRFFTIEIREKATDRLCAGEIGYTCGKAYTSLTGFSRVNGLGTVQLYALKRLLWCSGFEMWDLGMAMQYKNNLGASDLTRDQFVKLLALKRTTDCVLGLPNQLQRMTVKELFQGEATIPKASVADTAPAPAPATTASNENSTSSATPNKTPSKKSLKKAMKQQLREQAKARNKAQAARTKATLVEQEEQRQVKHARTTA